MLFVQSEPPAPRAVDSLTQLAHDSDPGVRGEAVAALAAVAPTAPQTASAIFAAIADPDPAVRHEAVRTLTVLPAGTAGTSEAVARAVKDPQIRSDAIAVMKILAPRAAEVPELLPLLADAVRGHGVEPSAERSLSDCQVDAINALVSLGEMRPDLPALFDALKSDNAPVVAAAIAALPRIDPDGKESIPLLTGLLSNASTHWVAVNSLLGMGAARQALAAVAADIRSPDPAVAQRAVEWVYADRPRAQDALLFDDVVPALIERLGDGPSSTTVGVPWT